MGVWTKDSKTDVAHMDSNDFYCSEVSTILEKEDNFKISFVGKDGKETVLKASLTLEKGEVVDANKIFAKTLN